MSAFKGRSAFIIVPFDEKAAVECAINVADALAAGDKKGAERRTLAKIKFDHQIVAIAKVNGATSPPWVRMICRKVPSPNNEI
ncbi:hypothetical protein SR858_26740 [Duganella zoogloeoides]|uniref:Uncharacterized protein n=1 Tax=Duganella zoogloeoides TaxID=75659 RepID=A0ABZ0XYP9_9BURK|nr:type II toxin-antitoxin system VapC family toxin [Duganella zoogloeoides]WQH04593.1 hypothetical protein SR858_26740 [Duganella zoogloeoides]